MRPLPLSREVGIIYNQAKDIARTSRTRFGSVHLLLALFVEDATPNQAQSVLEELEVDEDVILESFLAYREEHEPGNIVEQIIHRARQIAKSTNSSLVNSLHLLASLIRMNQAIAYKILDTHIPDIASLRTQVIQYITTSLPRRLMESGRNKLREKLPKVGWTGMPTQETPTMRQTKTPAPSQGPTPSHGPSKASHGAERAGVIDPTPLGEPDTGDDEDFRPRSQFELDPRQFPTLCSIGRNLTLLAESGKLDPLVGRAEELDAMMDILQKRRANNPVLVGEPGTGKTAIVEGYALEVAKGTVEEKVIVELNVSGILAGTQLRGAFSEKMAALREEVKEAGGRVIVFIDEIHTLVGAGATDGPMDAANDLKASLARGEFPCIGATTTQEYRRYIENDPALERRFQPIVVEEPSEEEAVAILEGVAPYYEGHHDVAYSETVLTEAVRLSRRYIMDRALPDKAINLLDLAGAQVSRAGRGTVTKRDLARVVARSTGVPEEKLLLSPSERIREMSAMLEANIVGQEEAVGKVTATITRNYAGFATNRPIGSFLFLGPTGVGKTETVKVLAEHLFDDREAILRLDMSEYMEAHAAAKLLGAPPGYVGYEQGGVLSSALKRRPYQIVLFDEVEKAHRDVLNLLLQILDEGVVQDSKSRKVFFNNTVIILTSNLGSDVFDTATRRVGFGAPREPDHDGASAKVIDTARKAFTPELFNRIEEKVVFHPLSREQVKGVARLLVKRSSDQLKGERGISFTVTDAVVEFLLDNGGFDPRYGARPMRRTIQTHVEGAVAMALLEGTASSGGNLRVDVVDGALVVKRI